MGTIVSFIDEANDDVTMIQFTNTVNHKELYELKNIIKNKIQKAIDNGEYYSADDKLILKKTLRELGYDYQIIQVSDYIVRI